jgi:hypothetical protein
MNAVPPPNHNIVLGERQPEYNTLPGYMRADGLLITAWELSDAEVAEITANRRIYLGQLTFGHAMQPILPSVSFDEVNAVQVP